MICSDVKDCFVIQGILEVAFSHLVILQMCNLDIIKLVLDGGNKGSQYFLWKCGTAGMPDETISETSCTTVVSESFL